MFVACSSGFEGCKGEKKNTTHGDKKVSPKKGSPKPKAVKETPTKRTMKEAHWAYVT